MLKHEYKANFWKQSGWEHKDASDVVDAQKMTKAKSIGGLLGAIVGIPLSITAVSGLDQLIDMPNPVEFGLTATGIALLTYLGVRAGKAIADYERNMYQS